MKQRGRPKGSNSFVSVNIQDLIKLVGPNAAVKVSKVWLRELGLTVDEEKPTIHAVATTSAPVEAPIEFTVTEEEDV